MRIQTVMTNLQGLGKKGLVKTVEREGSTLKYTDNKGVFKTLNFDRGGEYLESWTSKNPQTNEKIIVEHFIDRDNGVLDFSSARVKESGNPKDKQVTIFMQEKEKKGTTINWRLYDVSVDDSMPLKLKSGIVVKNEDKKIMTYDDNLTNKTYFKQITIGSNGEKIVKQTNL